MNRDPGVANNRTHFIIKLNKENCRLNLIKVYK